MSKKIFEKLSEKDAKVSDKKENFSDDASESFEQNEHEERLEQLTRDELMAELNAAEKKATEKYELALRLQAEKENIQRRSAKDVQNAHKFALEKFATELLPIVDSLELAASSVPEDMKEATKAVTDGVELTLKMFYSAMEKFALKQVNPVGEDFNPEFHQAIATQESDEVAPGKVISVMQKGYTLNDRLLRPALVVVSKADA